MDTNAEMTSSDALDELPDAVAAAAFRRLVRHLRHRHDAQNIELMGLAGFCRNCLADWINDAGAGLDKAAAREVIHGLPADEWKTRCQTEATPEQLARMAESVKRNAPGH
ncbi:DUF1244 domain-containing protein [Novosphingobium sp.]|uniref:DUF1244 domain-containing protein n=1 Tax=Novosphingobium sp. TaxID=1874826 RepID=UPI001D9A1DA0|nr:DUF1244 domain-containing protein [Novosphingobium sp.]MBX9661841.1 DUF1244 domain-containing protein [Novosphingobium sp.]